jgi:hypothetical protein
MIQSREAARHQDNEPRRVESPPHVYVDTSDSFWQDGVARCFELESLSRQIGIVLPFAGLRLGTCAGNRDCALECAPASAGVRALVMRRQLRGLLRESVRKSEPSAPLSSSVAPLDARAKKVKRERFCARAFGFLCLNRSPLPHRV